MAPGIANKDNSMRVPFDQSLSERIRICRVVAIGLVTMVHVPGVRDVGAEPGMTLLMVNYFLVSVIGDSAVPLLSIIAGFLFCISYQRTTYLGYIAKRTRSLAVPMVAWNLAMALLLLAVIRAGLDSATANTLLAEPWYDSLLGITKAPINGPLYFLRDLLVVSLLAPLLPRAAKHAPGSLLIMAFVFAVVPIEQNIILRPDILLFFVVGVVIHQHRIDYTALDWFAPTVLAGVAICWVLLMVHDFYPEPPVTVHASGDWADFVNRFLVVLVVWLLSAYALRSKLKAYFLEIESYIYVVFLSHAVVLTVVGGAFRIVFGTYEKQIFTLLLISAPLICIMAGRLIWEVIRRFRLLRLATAG